MAVAFAYFSDLRERPDEEIDLGRSALELARLEYPDLDVERYLRMIADLAAAIPVSTDPLLQIERINHRLFDLEKFRGNRTDYYNPCNSYLNDVLETRLGIPISLSVLYMEVGRRVGLELRGVGMPGHFLVKLRRSEGDLLIDPFNRGRILQLEDCQVRLQEVYGPAARLEPYMIEAVDKRQILGRMMNNLKQIWIGQENLKNALKVLHLQLTLFPDSVEELRQRAWVHSQLNDHRAAFADMQRLSEITGEHDELGEMLLDLQESDRAH